MKEHNWQENSQPRFPPQKTDQTPSQRRAKVWEWEAESWRCLSPVVTIPKVGGTQDMIETPSSMAHALPPARSQRSYQLCRGDYHAINLCYEWSRKPDLPLGVWKTQKVESNRLMESRARMRECHTGRWSVCCPAGEQMRTNYIVPLKSHEAKRRESHSVVSNFLWSHGLSMEFSRPEYWSG